MMGEIDDLCRRQEIDDLLDTVRNKTRAFNQIMQGKTNQCLEYAKRNNIGDVIIIGKNKMIPKKITKKYYVGKASVAGTDHCKATLQEAIDHAKEYVESTGDDQIVVQIVRVVRRMKPPISVEKV